MSEQTPYPQDGPPDQHSRSPSMPPSPPAYGQQYAPQYGQPYGDQVGFQPAGPFVDHPQATLAFVLGLLSVLGLTILGPFGWYYGRKAVREIDIDPRAYSNRGLAMAGMVLGIIGTVMLVLMGLVVIVGIVAVSLAASSTTGY